MHLGTSHDDERDADSSPAAVTAFAESMPLGYRVLFSPRWIRRHATIARARGARAAHVEVWSALHDRGCALCVVAEDRPGLLSAIAAVLVFHRIDVITALVFSRHLDDGASEAIDLFWVRRADADDGSPIDASEATSISETLNALLLGAVAIDDLAPEPSEVPMARAKPPVARCDPGDEENGFAVLVVEAPDRPGILLTITRALFAQGAQIVRSLVRTADGRAHNRFELTEMSGAALSRERCEQIAGAVLAAMAWTDAPPE